jgi:hypothetical protein
MINPRIFAFLAIIGFFMFLAFGGNILFPKKEVKVEENHTAIIVIENITTILVTPTPDGHIYFASEYQNGTRLLKRPYSFIRYNALGKQDMKVTTIVYDYKFFEKLHWYNPSMGKYYEQLPTEGYKWCFIMIYVYMDDEIGDDTRMWMFNRTFFSVYDEKTNNLFTAREYPYQLRYKELEETPTFDNAEYVQAFKQQRTYNNEEYAVHTAGEVSEEFYYLRGGKSNNIDGYLLFEIPKNSTENDLVVLGNFYTFGFSSWRLTF